jgi:glycosyltransferase involved in cell wall biosynthesis
MRVYFINSSLQGCYNVRCLFPLQANGWDGDRTSINPGEKTPENKRIAAEASEVVVFHRPEDQRRLELARHLKKQGKKIVFDNDDTYKDHTVVKLNKFINEERTKRGMAKINQYVDQFIIEADLVTCSTEFLAKEYRRLNPNVVVLPNCVDPFLYDDPLRNETDKIRIGVTGSIAVSSDLDVLAPIIRHYENDPRVQIVFFSLPANRYDKLVGETYTDEYAFLDSVNVEWHPYVDAHQYYDKLNSLRLDFMIIPRADNYFNRCKSNLKFLEASMFEIPCIAQGFTSGDSPYQQNPNDAEHMRIVTDNAQWIPTIEEFISNKELRLDMGKKAHDYVLKNYNIEDKASLWELAYASIL